MTPLALASSFMRSVRTCSLIPRNPRLIRRSGGGRPPCASGRSAMTIRLPPRLTDVKETCAMASQGTKSSFGPKEEAVSRVLGHAGRGKHQQRSSIGENYPCRRAKEEQRETQVHYPRDRIAIGNRQQCPCAQNGDGGAAAREVEDCSLPRVHHKRLPGRSRNFRCHSLGSPPDDCTVNRPQEWSS